MNTQTIIQKIKGVTFCITGTLSKSRKQYVQLIEDLGGRFKKGVSGDVNFLIVGNDAYSRETEKLERADKIGIKTLSEKDFLSMCDFSQVSNKFLLLTFSDLSENAMKNYNQIINHKRPADPIGHTGENMNVKLLRMKRNSENVSTQVAEPKNRRQKLSVDELKQNAEDAKVVEELAAKTGISMPKPENEPMPEAPAKRDPGKRKPIRKKATATGKQTARQTTKPVQQPTEKNVRKVFLYDYSEKSVAVFGETRPIKDKLKSMGGRFNAYLHPFGPENAMPGWIFPAKKRDELAELIK